MKPSLSVALREAARDATVGRIRIPNGELRRVILRRRDAFGERFIPGLGLDHSEPGVAVDEDVVGSQRLAPPPVSLDAAERDRVFPLDAAAFDRARPAALRAGSMCSALVSASFIGSGGTSAPIPALRAVPDVQYLHG